MKTETHWKLGLKILKQEMSEMPLKSRMAFAFGCIKPDIDIFSYLRGFKTKPFYGHNWSNAQKYIIKLTQKAERKSLSSFGFGLLVHYLCDAFTFTHNECFAGGFKAHAVYEKMLHTSFMEFESKAELFQLNITSKLSNAVENMHLRYTALPNTVFKDIEFINLAVGFAVTAWKNSVYSDSDAKKRCCEARYASRP